MTEADRARLLDQAELEYSLLREDLKPEYQRRLEEIIALTDAVCRDHLAPLECEYEVYCRLMAACCCKRGSPVVEGRGKPDGWAAGILWSLGTVNFLDDKSFEPAMSGKQAAAAFGVSVATMQAKSRQIRAGLDIWQFDPEWTLPSLLDMNPLVWLVETVDGLALDVRDLPREQQRIAFERGMIPYIPAD